MFRAARNEAAAQRKSLEKEPMVGNISMRSIEPEQDTASVYQLMDEIYCSTEMMCEKLSEKYPNHESLRADLEEYQSSAGSFFLLAEDGAAKLGYICVKTLKQSKLAHTAYLNMGIASQARGKKLGRTLLTAALDRIKQDGVVEILYLNVRQDNVSAVRLYESFGFETIAVLDRDTKYDGQYFTGLLMRLFI